MATDSFKFWDSYYDALKVLDTNDQRGEFLMKLCTYVFEGVEPTFSDQMVEMAFRFCSKQAEESMLLSKKARERGFKSGESRRKKSKTNTVRNTVRNSGSNRCSSNSSNEEKRSEAKGTEASHSLRECSGAAYAGSGSRPPATPAQADPWDDPDYDGPIPYGEGGDADWS